MPADLDHDDDPPPVALLEQEFTTLPVGDLRPHPDNPNKGDLDVIEGSMRRVGFFGAVLAQAPRGRRKYHRILDGEQRWTVARDTGADTVPVIVVDVDDETALRILAVANRANRLGHDAEDELAALLAKLNDTDDGLDGTGYLSTDLDALLRSLDGADDEDPDTGEDDDPGDAPEKPVTNFGDVWLLGPHRLMCGDSLADDGADVATLLAGASVDLVLTDPPYAIYGSSTGVSSDAADDSMVRPFFASMFRVIRRHLVEFGHAYVHCDWRSWASLWLEAPGAGITVKNMLVWDKGGAGMGNNYSNTHELVLFASHMPPQTVMSSDRKAGQRQVLRPNVLRFPRPTGDARQHNAAKPIDMQAEMVTNSTDEGATVLDMFGGSGTVLMACDRVGRVAYLMEKKPGWVDVICRRYQRATGTAPVLERTGKPHDFLAV